jgi:hypothetical protein
MGDRYDWSPLWSAIQQVADKQSSQNEYAHMVGVLGAGGDGGGVLGGSPDQIAMLRSLPPSVGMSLLGGMLKQKEYSTTPVFDAQGRAHLLGKDGSDKIVPGLTPREKLDNINGVATNMYTTAPGSALPQNPNQAFNNGPNGAVVPNAAFQNYTRGNIQMQQGPQWARLAEDRRHNGVIEANGGTGGGAPAGYRKTADGTGLEFIPGGPADPNKGAGKKAPTEDQAKNTQLYTRAAAQLPTVLKYFDSLGSVGNQIGALTGSPMMVGEEYQRADGALQDIAASYLYSVSGATATPSEITGTVNRVKPRIGDTEATKADKKARLTEMVESIKARAVPGSQPLPASPMQQQAPASRLPQPAQRPAAARPTVRVFNPATGKLEPAQ